jgi:tripartite-type tricarboxylate transporter receptor subunit TctC
MSEILGQQVIVENIDGAGGMTGSERVARPLLRLFLQRMREIGFYATGAGTTQEMGVFIRSQYEAWGNVIRQIGIQTE